MSGFWDDALGILTKIAPTIATAVGGPFAGTATQAIIGALGLAPDTPPEEVARAVVAATPDQLLAIKKAENEYAVRVKELDLSSDQLAKEDTASARAREVALRDHTPKALAVLAVINAMAITWMALSGKVQVQGEFAAMVVSLMLTPYTLVYGYYFGSSMGSARKDSPSISRK